MKIVDGVEVCGVEGGETQPCTAPSLGRPHSAPGRAGVMKGP